MAAVSVVTVQASSPIINGNDLVGMRVLKAAKGNTAPIFLGPPGVSVSTGFPLDPGESLTMDAKVDRAPLHAVAAANQTLYVFGF